MRIKFRQKGLPQDRDSLPNYSSIEALGEGILTLKAESEEESGILAKLYALFEKPLEVTIVSASIESGVIYYELDFVIKLPSSVTKRPTFRFKRIPV